MAERHSIFIGYRRTDTADVSGRVYDRVVNAFGAEAVFKDVDDLDPGAEFGAHIVQILTKCRVFLAMIGPNRADARDETGARRLDDPDDWVRIELETALNTPNVEVVPVLVNGAPMPSLAELPDSLKRLRSFNAATVRRDPDFHKDMDRLIRALQAGARTGRFEVSAPVAAIAGSAAAWKLIEESLDPHDYADFQTLFPGTPEVIYASRHKRQLEAWARTQKDDPAAIANFIQTGPFSALETKAREAQQAAAAQRDAARAADAKRAREAAANAEKRAKAQTEEAASRQRAQATARAPSPPPQGQSRHKTEQDIAISADFMTALRYVELSKRQTRYDAYNRVVLIVCAATALFSIIASMTLAQASFFFALFMAAVFVAITVFVSFFLRIVVGHITRYDPDIHADLGIKISERYQGKDTANFLDQVRRRDHPMRDEIAQELDAQAKRHLMTLLFSGGFSLWGLGLCVGWGIWFLTK
jgi:hypothetical protein